MDNLTKNIEDLIKNKKIILINIKPELYINLTLMNGSWPVIEFEKFIKESLSNLWDLFEFNAEKNINITSFEWVCIENVDKNTIFKINSFKDLDNISKITNRYSDMKLLIWFEQFNNLDRTTNTMYLYINTLDPCLPEFYLFC